MIRVVKQRTIKRTTSKTLAEGKTEFNGFNDQVYTFNVMTNDRLNDTDGIENERLLIHIDFYELENAYKSMAKLRKERFDV